MSTASQLQRIALGTVQFGLAYGIANTGGQVERNEAAAILQMASQHGINTLDTAVAYGDSEAVLGDLGIKRWNIVSKLPEMPGDCTDPTGWLESQVQDSLGRLRIGKLYGLLLHRPGQLLAPEGEALYRALCTIRARGMVEKVGISVYEPNELEQLFAHMNFDLVQAPFSVFDRRLCETGWISRLRSLGCELHVRSIFLQGLLLLNPALRPPYFDRWRGLWRHWEAWLLENGLTPVEACLRYALNVSGIEKVVLGVDSTAQLRQILDAAAGPLPAVPHTLQTTAPDLLNPARWVKT